MTVLLDYVFHSTHSEEKHYVKNFLEASGNTNNHSCFVAAYKNTWIVIETFVVLVFNFLTHIVFGLLIEPVTLAFRLEFGKMGREFLKRLNYSLKVILRLLALPFILILGCILPKHIYPCLARRIKVEKPIVEIPENPLQEARIGCAAPLSPRAQERIQELTDIIAEKDRQIENLIKDDLGADAERRLLELENRMHQKEETIRFALNRALKIEHPPLEQVDLMEQIERLVHTTEKRIEELERTNAQKDLRIEELIRDDAGADAERRLILALRDLERKNEQIRIALGHEDIRFAIERNVASWEEVEHWIPDFGEGWKKEVEEGRLCPVPTGKMGIPEGWQKGVNFRDLCVVLQHIKSSDSKYLLVVLGKEGLCTLPTPKDLNDKIAGFCEPKGEYAFARNHENTNESWLFVRFIDTPLLEESDPRIKLFDTKPDLRAPSSDSSDEEGSEASKEPPTEFAWISLEGSLSQYSHIFIPSYREILRLHEEQNHHIEKIPDLP